MKKSFVLLFAALLVFSAFSAAFAEDYTVPTNETYNAMSADELYKLAIEENNTIVVYCTTSKLSKVAESFMEEYPELKVEINDLDGGESITKVVTEVDADNPVCDVVQDSDARGDIAFNYYGKYLDAYFPAEIVANVDPELLTYGMPYYTSISYWFYNTEAFPDGAPVNNWWDIVEVDENGEQKYNLYSKEIGSEASYLALFSNFVANPEPLEAAYEEKYGEPITYTYDADVLGFEPENAGYELLYRLSQLKVTFISDGDELVEAVATSTGDKPVLSLTSASKIGNRDDNGWPIAWVTEMSPYISTQKTNYVYTVPSSDSPAGSRLFIWYMLGGHDGSGKGYAPIMKEGSWSIRNDFVNENNPFTLAESNTIPADLVGIYAKYLDVSDFWTYWHDVSPNK